MAMRNYVIFGIGIVVFIILMGHTLNGCKCLGEGFKEGNSAGRGGGVGRGGGKLSGGRGYVGDHVRPTESHVDHLLNAPPTIGAISKSGYYPVYTHYEYPVYYSNPTYYYEISDSKGIFYYLYNPSLFFRRIFGY
jgi:hypothetical protein